MKINARYYLFSIAIIVVMSISACTTQSTQPTLLDAYNPKAVRAASCNYGGEIRSVQAIDEYTVRFTLCYPDSAFRQRSPPRYSQSRTATISIRLVAILWSFQPHQMAQVRMSWGNGAQERMWRWWLHPRIGVCRLPHPRSSSDGSRISHAGLAMLIFHPLRGWIFHQSWWPNRFHTSLTRTPILI